MSDEQLKFLSVTRLCPARLNVEQVAWVLNCQEHDIPTLVRAGLLKPLRNPSRSGTKYFAAAEIEQLAKDRAWLSKATNAIRDHWRIKNGTKIS